jgi:mRNA (guanine-N7-)-methyltransferase
MATQQPINILQYILAQTGSSSLFPTEYPTPPEPPVVEDVIAPIPSAAPTTSDSTALVIPTQIDTPRVSVSDHELLWHYLFHTCNQNPKVAQQCIDQKSLPGPKATPFRCSHLELIKQSPENYVVCEKTDGDRAILVISPEHGEIYFVYRNHTVERLHSDTELTTTSNTNKDWLHSLPGLSVFDGELVSGNSKSSNKDSRVAAYLCFDAIFLNGQFIGNQPNYSLVDRMRCADEWFKQSAAGPLSDLFLKQHPTIRSSLPLLFRCKEMLMVQEINEITSKMTPNVSATEGGGAGGAADYWGWIYDSPSDPTDPQADVSFPHLCDGLVFTPINLNYYEYLAIKWKPCHMCTNDYWLSLSDLRKLQGSRGGKGEDHVITGYLPLSNKQSDAKISISQVKITSQQVREILSSLQHQSSPAASSRSSHGPSHVIGECYYDKQLSLWRVYKIRDDKATPNTLQAAWSNLEVISEGLELSTILNSMKELKKTQQQQKQCLVPPVAMTAGVSSTAIDKHYDQIQHLRHQQRGSLESRIAMHRKVMNWSKACLLQHTLTLSSSLDTPSSIDHDHSLITQALTALQANTRLTSSSRPPNFLKAGPHQNYSKRRAGGGGGEGRGMKMQQINVMDLACGRGGDIKKFTSETKVGAYLGIDISGEQIKECIERTKENRSILSSSFHHGDAGDGKWQAGYPVASYDLAWCMFAFHYFCDTEIHCRNFLEAVACLLKPHGKFVLTFPNPFAIHHQLSSAMEDVVKAEAEGKEPICSVRYHPPAGEQQQQEEQGPEGSQGFQHSLEDCLNQFGIQYHFTLGDAVQDCPEFIVPLQKVLELAEEFHFSLVPSSGHGLVSMNQWIEEVCLANENYLSLRSPMQVCGPRAPGRNVTLEEWNAISLYSCLTFEKLP